MRANDTQTDLPYASLGSIRCQLGKQIYWNYRFAMLIENRFLNDFLVIITEKIQNERKKSPSTPIDNLNAK